jgi:GDPmannose 4,6-dehydratase
MAFPTKRSPSPAAIRKHSRNGDARAVEMEYSPFGVIASAQRGVTANARGFPPMRRALITGITGQDGSYLAELLLDRGYQVHGLVRRVAFEDPEHRLWRIRHIVDRLHLHSASMESYASIFRAVEDVQPDECYHLAAQSYVGYSFDDEFSTVSSNINGAHYMLSAIRERAPRCRFYFAASSEMFGNAPESPQTETTAFHPRSPYGISKVGGFHLARNYREAHGLNVCSGILFNHESERRGREFVTRKISAAAASIKVGLSHEFRLGNVEARRDWGYAPDYVEAMWRILQNPVPADYVIASGVSHTVRDFAAAAFACVDLDWQDRCIIDETLYRPAEVNELRGDASRARRDLDWEPKVSFATLVSRMVEADVQRLRRDPLAP